MLTGLAGTESREYAIDGPTTVADVLEMVKSDFPALREVLDRRSVMVSVNQEFAAPEDQVKDGDEVGLLPPFSGG